MELITWARAKRRIPQADIDSFYHRPLAAPTLFRFDTASFDMPAHAGPFSLKAVLAGEETYEIGARTITLRPGEFMFVNGGETYSSRIDTQTRSLSIFLPARDARLAARSALDGANDIPESIARRTFCSCTWSRCAQTPFLRSCFLAPTHSYPAAPRAPDTTLRETVRATLSSAC